MGNPGSYVLVRETIQETEARILIEKLLLDKKLTGDIAQKCQDVLDERAVIWYGESTIQPCSLDLRAKLFQAAADATKATAP